MLGGDEITAPGVDPDKVRRRIGIVFQAFNLFPHMTVLRNVTLGPTQALGSSKAEAEREALELLGRFGARSTAPATIPTGSPAASSSVSRSCALAMQPELRCCSTRDKRARPGARRRC